jgi:hypothetical protein
MQVWAPLRAARWAARTLVIMPPLLMPLPAPPAMASRAVSSARCSAISVAVGSCAGRRCTGPLLVGEDDQRLGLDQVGDQRAEGVVVAELDLVGDDGVVLVDDRHDAQLRAGW